jgi:hypothetical protein
MEMASFVASAIESRSSGRDSAEERADDGGATVLPRFSRRHLRSCGVVKIRGVIDGAKRSRY